MLRLVERPVTSVGQDARVQAELPISAYWYPGPAVVEVGCYELDPGRGRRIDPPAADHQRSRRHGAAAGGRTAPAGRRRGDLRQRAAAARLRLRVGTARLHLDYHREIAQAGVHLYADWFGASRSSDMGHVAPDRYDYAEFDRYFAAILDVDPQAYFLPHIGVTGPQWWQTGPSRRDVPVRRRHARGPPRSPRERWRREMGDDLRRLIAYLRKAPYADRILGYMFFNGYTAEWQMWGTWEASRDDYSQPALRAFRAFLARPLRHRRAAPRPPGTIRR